MRDLILSTMKLESMGSGLRVKKNTDNVSFKITLHVPEENATCSELNEAFAEGTWVISEEGEEEREAGSDGEGGRGGGSKDAAAKPAAGPADDELCSLRLRRAMAIRPLFSTSTPFCDFNFVMRKRPSRRRQKQRHRRSDDGCNASSDRVTAEDDNRKPAPKPSPP